MTAEIPPPKLEFFHQNPAQFERGKWRFPDAKTLHQTWFLPPEFEPEIEEFAHENAQNPLAFESLAIAFYRIENREKSRFFAAQLPRESAVLLRVAQILDDDETYLHEMARVGFAPLEHLGYFENLVKIGGPRLARARRILDELEKQTTNSRHAQMLRKLRAMG